MSRRHMEALGVFFDSVRLEVRVQRVFCQLLVSRRGPSSHTES